MTKWKKLSHTIYQCKYHIVWCPKYIYRILKGVVAEFVEQTLRMLCEWRNIEILEMNVKEDHIHMILSIPPRLSISEVMGMLYKFSHFNPLVSCICTLDTRLYDIYIDRWYEIIFPILPYFILTYISVFMVNHLSITTFKEGGFLRCNKIKGFVYFRYLSVQGT